jgi:Flp pilus assembly protein TadB
MKSTKSTRPTGDAAGSAAAVGVAAVACVACCAGPIMGLVAAVGLASVAGIAVFGSAGLVVVAIGGWLLWRRHQQRQRSASCASTPTTVALDVSTRQRAAEHPPTRHRAIVPTSTPGGIAVGGGNRAIDA